MSVLKKWEVRKIPGNPFFCKVLRYVFCWGILVCFIHAYSKDLSLPNHELHICGLFGSCFFEREMILEVRFSMALSDHNDTCTVFVKQFVYLTNGCFRKWWYPKAPQNDHFL